MGKSTYPDAPSLTNKIPTIGCKCIYPCSKDMFDYSDGEIEIKFSQKISFSNNFYLNFLEKENAFYLKDQNKSIFKIKYFIDSSGNKVTTSYRGEISGVVIPRIPTLSTESYSKTLMKKDHLVQI